MIMNEELLQHLRLAIEVGKQSQTEDDRSHPKVGAVAIMDGAIIATAYRGEMGEGDHAEYTLFNKKLGNIDLKGAILITTLEPCVSRNRQKPCSDWVIEKGISKVYIGMLDPNPKIYNKGVTKLRQHGIDVHYFPPDLREEIEADNSEFRSQFRGNPLLEGRAVFDYTNNDGKYTIGNNECVFETRWSKASDCSIYLYKDSTNLQGIAIALDLEQIADARDASIYDMSSRLRTVNEGQVAVLKNHDGYYAAIKIVDILDRGRSDNRDELVFDYQILNDKCSDFTCR